MDHLLLLFASVTAQYNLPPGLLQSICTVESGLTSNAIHKDDGTNNSVGICQLHVDTARFVGFRGPETALFDPGLNIKYAGLYLRNRLSHYHNDSISAIATYNSGTLRLNKYGKIKNQKYVEKVLKEWKKTQH